MGQIQNVTQTIAQPELILEGDYGEYLAIRKFEKTPVSNNKYLVAIYKETENDGFLLPACPLIRVIAGRTSYFTRKYNQNRKIIWMPSNS